MFIVLLPSLEPGAHASTLFYFTASPSGFSSQTIPNVIPGHQSSHFHVLFTLSLSPMLPTFSESLYWVSWCCAVPDSEDKAHFHRNKDGTWSIVGNHILALGISTCRTQTVFFCCCFVFPVEMPYFPDVLSNLQRENGRQGTVIPYETRNVPYSHCLCFIKVCPSLWLSVWNIHTRATAEQSLFLVSDLKFTLGFWCSPVSLHSFHSWKARTSPCWVFRPC